MTYGDAGKTLYKGGEQFCPSWDKDGSAKARITNKIAYQRERTRLHDMALGRFAIDNAPPEIYMPRVWQWLLYQNLAWSYDEEIGEFVALPVANISGFDIYGNPGGSVQLHSGENGYTLEAERGKFEIMRESLSVCEPLGVQLDYYAARISKIDRVIDGNVNARKTPIILSGEKKKLLDMLNVAKKYEDGTPYIYSRERFAGEDSAVMEVLNPAAGVEFIADRLEALRKSLADRAAALCAVEIAAEKAERLNSVEVEKSQGAALSHGASSYLALRDFCDRFNRNPYLSAKMAEKGYKPLRVRVAGAALYESERNEEYARFWEIDKNG